MELEIKTQVIELLKYLYLEKEIQKSDGIIGLGRIVNEIVAEIDILKKVPQLKLQIYQEIPKQIENIYQNLLKKGFNKYILTEDVIRKFILKLKNDTRYAYLDLDCNF